VVKPALAYESVLLVERLRGTLPVVLACGHDGDEQPEGVRARKAERFPDCDFNAAGDLRVTELTRTLAERLRERTGEAPYVVIAAFHRRYIDANRAERCACEPGPAQAFYRAYHAALRGFVEEIRAESGGIGLLLDLHGVQRREEAPADIYIGTENGLTITALRAGTSEDALYRRRGLVGLLQAAGYALLPAAAGAPEHPAFTGGYTVETYGSHQADGIDAIQLEIAAELRTNAAARTQLAADLADAIASLAPRWLPAPPRRPGAGARS
jgi:N-formylglutamate amidohydrolase